MKKKHDQTPLPKLTDAGQPIPSGLDETAHSRWQRRGNPRSWSYTGESPEWTDHDDPDQLAVGTGPNAEAVARRNAEFYARITDAVEYRGLNPDGSVAWQYPENAEFIQHQSP